MQVICCHPGTPGPTEIENFRELGQAGAHQDHQKLNHPNGWFGFCICEQKKQGMVNQV